MAAGLYHTALIRSDGTAVACGNYGRCTLPKIPALDGDLTYTQVAVGSNHIVLLKSDGTAVACGNNTVGQCNLPALDGDLTYTQAAAGGYHTVLLRSDGTAVACGRKAHGQCNAPALNSDRTYTQVSAGGYHTVLLRSDGTAVAFGDNEDGQCDLPALDDDRTFTQVDAGANHTVLLRSDGTAVACGNNRFEQCILPALDGVWPWIVSSATSLLLDGDGQCNIPGLTSWARWLSSQPLHLHYVPNRLVKIGCPVVIFQTSFDGQFLYLHSLDGQERSKIEALSSDRLADMLRRVRRALATSGFRIVLPGAVTLSDVLKRDPDALLGSYCVL